jgi:hypothetical protein
MKTIRILTLVMLLFVAVNALIAGAIFIIDPSGHLLYMDKTALQYTTFTNFLIPGIILFIVNGICNVVAVMYMILHRKGWKMMVFLQGLLLFGWIVIQVIMLHDLYFLHVVMAGIGIMLMLSALTLDEQKVR